MDFFESKATLDKIEQKPYNYSHGKETSKISEEISKTEGGVDNKISWKVLEKRFPEVISAISGRIKSPVKEIHTLEDAARHGYDYLIKYPQEQLLATITDKEGKILSTHFLSKGDRASSQIDLKEIAGIATREKGAANVYLKHNHPSGKSELSDSDINTYLGLKNLLDRTGIDAKGIVAVTIMKLHLRILIMMDGIMYQEALRL